MHVSLESAVEGFIAFMADQVAQIPKLGDRFLGYAALGSLKGNPAMLTGRAKPWFEMAGMMEDGKLNLDSAKAALDMAFENVPKVSYFGFSFTADDVKSLMAKVRAAAASREEG